MKKHTLDWKFTRGGFVAACGEEKQGEARVLPLVSGGVAWFVDMLPNDPEPVVSGHADTLADAKDAAERQVATWPALIKGAER